MIPWEQLGNFSNRFGNAILRDGKTWGYYCLGAGTKGRGAEAIVIGANSSNSHTRRLLRRKERSWQRHEDGRPQLHSRLLSARVTSVLLFLISILAACRPAPAETAATLILEEHALATAPAADTFSFEPVEGSQEEVLARHSAEREKNYQVNTTTMQGNPALLPNGEASNLVAMLTTSEQNPPEQSVQVLLAGAPIFTAEAGLPSPLLPLQGLWSYGGHWALEILFTNETMWAGQVYVDGELLNELKGYDEAFGFQLLGGKPFYFYQREGHAGYSYDGQETDLEYDLIPHYYCCGETALNPVQAEDMVAFFAQKGEEWYYVEMGNFE